MFSNGKRNPHKFSIGCLKSDPNIHLLNDIKDKASRARKIMCIIHLSSFTGFFIAFRSNRSLKNYVRVNKINTCRKRAVIWELMMNKKNVMYQTPFVFANKGSCIIGIENKIEKSGFF